MANFKLSIVTISYNQAQFLQHAIESVINQGDCNFEYIIIDGGSTDRSIDILQKYDEHIEYWVSEKDMGAADALNKGFKKATGEYIYYLNSDDVLLPNSLKRIRKIISTKPGFDVYYGHGYILFEEKKNRLPIYSDLWGLNQYASGNVTIIQQSTFIKRSRFEKTSGFNISNRTCWDGELLVDLAMSGASFQRYNDHLALFRVHDNSITGSQKTKEEHTQNVFRIRDKILMQIGGNSATVSFNARLEQVWRDPIIQGKKFIAKILRLISGENL